MSLMIIMMKVLHCIFKWFLEFGDFFWGFWLFSVPIWLSNHWMFKLKVPIERLKFIHPQDLPNFTSSFSNSEKIAVIKISSKSLIRCTELGTLEITQMTFFLVYNRFYCLYIVCISLPCVHSDVCINACNLFDDENIKERVAWRRRWLECTIFFILMLV